MDKIHCVHCGGELVIIKKTPKGDDEEVISACYNTKEHPRMCYRVSWTKNKGIKMLKIEECNLDELDLD